MTISSNQPKGLFIQSSKLIDWLLSRKLIQNDYPKRIVNIGSKLNELTNNSQIEEDSSYFDTPYFFCHSMLERARKRDSKVDFFGRESAEVRAWKELTDLYQKQNLFIAELGELIHDIASTQYPRCRSLISDKQREITDLNQKMKEHTQRTHQKEDALCKSFRQFNIKFDEHNIRLRLLECSMDTLVTLNEYVKQLKILQPAVDLYHTFSGYVHSSGTDGQVNSRCSTLKLLIDLGHVHFFTFKYGRSPKSILQDDDFVPQLHAKEQSLVSSENEAKQLFSSNQEPSINDDVEQISWSDIEENTIDFGSDELGTDPIEIELEVDDVSEPVIESSPITKETITKKGFLDNSISIDDDLASGKDARLLLDTFEGRTALLNDLAELGAFLLRFSEELTGSQGSGSRDDLQSSVHGTATLQHMIMQGAPEHIQSITVENVNQMLDLVERATNDITNSAISQFIMIRTKPGYLDRLVNRLMDLRHQVDRSKNRVIEVQMKIQQVTDEQEHMATELVRYRTKCKQLVSRLEQELSKLCDRPVQIIGQVLDT